MHATWKDSHYDWLPGLNEIPKHLGEKLDEEYLNTLEVRIHLSLIMYNGNF